MDQTLINTKHDATCYDSLSCYTREIFDANSLYDGFVKAKKGSDWKPQVQQFELTYLLNLSRMQRDLKNKEYEFLPSSQFVLKERGKTRVIRGEQIQDRIIKHVLCDEILNPVIYNYLIFDNAASQVGKGISFTRRRLEYHLNRFYRTHKTNKGYILLVDYSKYYDNIRHDFIFRAVKPRSFSFVDVRLQTKPA